MTPDKLQAMQADAKARYRSTIESLEALKKLLKPPVPIEPKKEREVKIKKQKPAPRLDIAKVVEFGKRIAPKKEIIRRPLIIAPADIEDYSPTKFIRPKAEYSNASPFGIASELHGSK